ncbi:tail fiber domain-containing protein [Enterococcus cecorum]|uniref:tail fiber domain-containing protein n=1 Tax=Enterococcus cecorum TaxID=44008 RepID=UPI0032C494EE
MTRIAIRDSTDSYNIDFFDNTNGIKYHSADLEVYAQGSAFLDLKYYSKTQIVDVGMRLAFEFRGKDYWMTVTSVSRESEYEYQVEARSLSLEALREVRSAYKASRNMTFAEYLNVFDPEHSIRLNVNTIADRSRQLEWTGEDTILARILSLATKFDAEIAFETELNDDYSLKEFRLNVHALNELGKDRTGMPFRISNSQLKLIKFKSSIDEFYSAIRGTGKDGLSISGLDKKVYDDEKKLLFYTSGGTIYAPQARDKFISITNKKTSDGYIVREFDNTEHATKEALYAYMLGELKKHCEPQIDYTIDGYIDADVNDKVLLIDDKYTTDDLMLTARVIKQKWSLIDKLQGNNRTELSNYVRVYSEIADELITRMNALIEANKVFDVQILTSNGYSFKNGFGETTLTARVMDGPKDVTSEFSLTWFKNSTEYAHTASINVQAGSIDELATYLIIAEKDGRERGRNELTVFNVKDGSPGKTPVVHLAWADSADGSVGFSLELPTDKIRKYRGYYVDYSTVASTNPMLYKWERNPDDAAKVADEAKSKADSANTKADSAVSVANNAKDTADEASKQTALVNALANTAKDLADKANADAAEANRLIGLANTEIGKLNTNVENTRKDLASAESDLASKIETVKTTVTNDYAKKTELSDTKLTLSKTISDSVASVKQEMSEKYAVKSDLTTLQGEYNSFKEETAKKISQQVSSISTIQTNTSEAQKLANDAYSKANSAVTSATNASSTANSAMMKASDATSVANSASQNANSAVASANSAVSTASQAKSNADKAIADVASLTKTVSSQSTRIDQTSSRIEQVASGVTEIGGKLDNLQVGGENYFSTLLQLTFNSNNEYELNSYQNTGSYTSFRNLIKPMKEFYKKEVMLSFDAISPNGETELQVYNWNGSPMYMITHNNNYVIKLGTISNVWAHFDVKLEIVYRKDGNESESDKLEFYAPSKTGVKIRNVDIYESNKPRAYQKPNADLQTNIDRTNSNLSNNYYQKTTVDSKLSTAVSGITAQYTKDITTKLGNYYDKSTIDSKLTIDGQGIATYVKNTQSKLDNLQIGGRNLLPKRTIGLYVGGTTHTGELINLLVDGYKITTTAKPVDLIGFVSSTITGSEITVSGLTNLASINCYYQFRKKDGSTAEAQQNLTVKVVGGKFEFSITVPTSATYIHIGLGQYPYVENYYIENVKLVNGNKATDWSPAPEDMATTEQYTEVKQLADQLSATVYDSASGLVTKTTQLANSYAIKQLNSSGDILTSLNLNANTSTAEINAKLIRLNGYTKMDDSFINNLVANSIVTNKIKSTEISGDYIRGGTIQGVKIISNNGPGNVTLNYGRIEMDLIEPIEPNVNRNSIGTFTPSYITMASYIDRGSTPQLDGSVMLDYTGFTSRIKDDDGTIQNRRLEFNSEGFHIYPIDASGYALNSGIRLFGRHAYLDLNGNKTTKTKGTVSRIISGPDGSMQIINNDGNIYMMTKNGEQPIANGYKLIYTWGSPNDMSVRHIRMVNSSSSSPYAEIQNNAGTAFGMNVWKSDQRLKSNIQSPTQDALATINQLQVRQFDWKSDNVHEDFGLVAQEVEQVLPNAVFKVGDYYQIKDSGLIPVLIGAVQKLSNKVNLLENIIYNTKGSNLL